MAAVRSSTETQEEDKELLTDSAKLAKGPNDGQNGVPNEGPGDGSRKQDEIEDDPLAGLPVDRGWAWMILIGATLEVFIYGGILKSYGVFFVQFQKRFGSSASETTLVQTMFNVTISVSGIFVMTVGMQRMTARTSVFIGGFITSMAYLVSAFARHIEVLIFCLGAVAGVAASMIFLPVISYIGIYFNKHRGIANSINVAGASLGGLVFGPIFSMMFEHYGYTGTMLISSGLLLNILVAGCLLRPPEYYTKRKRLQSNKRVESPEKADETVNAVKHNAHYHKNGELKGNGALDSDGSVNIGAENRTTDTDNWNGNHTNKISKSLLVRTTSQPADSVMLLDAKHGEDVEATGLNGHRTRTVSECNHHSYEIPAVKNANLSLYNNVDSLCGSLISLRSEQSKSYHETTDVIVENLTELKSETYCVKIKSTVVNFFKTVFDPAVLKDRVFIHFLLFSFVLFAPSLITPVYYVPFANDIDLSSDNINVLLVLIGCTDLVSRISCGVIADRKWIRPTTMVGIAYIILGIIQNFTRLIETFEAMIVFVLISSTLAGVYIALFAVILVENLGIEKFKSALGFINMSHGATGAIFFPITGLLRDATDSYHWTYHLLSVLVLIGAVLSLTMPITYNRYRKTPPKNLIKEQIVE